MNFEQLLFFEIFELLHKFGSNWDFKTNGNSVNMGNSARGSHLIVGELLTCSGHRRGPLRLCAGTVKAVAWLLLASEPYYKACVAVVLRRFFLCFFPSPPPSLR